jgi:calcineurin B family protein 1
MVLEADLDGDDLISFEEFCNVLHRIDVEKKMSIRILS